MSRVLSAVLVGAVIVAAGAAGIPGPKRTAAPGGVIVRVDRDPEEGPMRWLAFALMATFTAAPAFAQDTKAPKPKRAPNVISLEEIDKIRNEVSNAHEIVQRLRPNFLRNRGADSFGNAAGGTQVQLARVVVDGVPRGDLDQLRQVSSMTIREVRYLNGTDASMQFGTGYGGGAILVFTR